MTYLRRLWVLLQDVWRDLLRLRAQNVLAVLTLASGLLLAGGGLLLLDNLKHYLGRASALARIVVFAPEGGNLKDLKHRLSQDLRFVSVVEISSQEATRRFTESFRNGGILVSSLGPQAIPANLELTLRPDLVKAGKAGEVGEQLRTLSEAGDVVVDHERLESLHATVKGIQKILTAFGVLFLLAAGFATGNVIRLTIVSREDEIAIMRLVGAKESFILTPLLIQGAALGLAGFILAVASLLGLWILASRGLGNLPPLILSLSKTSFFSVKSLILLGLVGTLTGALGSLWGFWSTGSQVRKET